MLTISYSLSLQWTEAAVGIDLSDADETTLRYEVFLGDLILVVADVDLSARWDWIPLLDAAAVLDCVVRDLRSGKKQVDFDFTEAEALIQFAVDPAGLVCVTSTYASGRGCVHLDELQSGVQEFAERVLADAVALYPSLARNPCLPGWYPRFPEPRS